MIEVKKKYIYEAEKLNNFHGMVPLDIYASMVYFNYNKEDFKNSLISITELIDFLTECLLEILVSELKFNDEFELLDVYLSAIPSISSDSVKKVVLIFCNDKKVIVSEQKIEGNEGFKMKSVGKEYMMTLMLSCHKLAVKLIHNIIEKCANCKKISVMGMNDSAEEVKEHLENSTNEKIEVTEQKIDKFDLRDYQRLK